MQIFTDLLNSLIPSAYAAAQAPGAPQGGGMSFMLLTGIFLLFMYFVMWRPQSKRAREQRTMLNQLAKGDEVVTAGGMVGKITKVNDNYIVLFLSENVEIIVQKNSIVNVLPKGTIKTLA